MKRIYLDNAASTQLLPEVVEGMIRIMQEMPGNPSAIHKEGRSARAIIEDARKKVAKMLNASIGEIFFTSGGTEANNTAIKCAVRDLGITRMITTPIEHHAVLHSVESMHRDQDIELKFLSLDHQGRIDLSELEALLQNQSKKTLVSIMYANNEIGTLYPIASIADVCDRYGAYLHTDAVQAVGHIPIDLQKIKVHFLSASAHKFHGPKGVGILFIRNGVSIHPYIDGGSQERNMRGGTESTHNIAGLSIALDAAIQNLDARDAHILHLKNYFKHSLLEFNPDIEINGDPVHSLNTILSVSFPPHPKSDMLLLQLDIAGISASGGSACTSGAEAGSHVLAALQHDPDRKTIRFSFSHLNTIEEIDQVLNHLQAWYPSVKV